MQIFVRCYNYIFLLLAKLSVLELQLELSTLSVNGQPSETAEFLFLKYFNISFNKFN